MSQPCRLAFQTLVGDPAGLDVREAEIQEAERMTGQARKLAE